jgi:3-methyl-2-oxobutanoate hydroxymethyltransferase
VNTLGGYKVQGRTEEKATKLLADAKAVCEAGAFAVTLECVPEPLAKQITEQIPALTIGIGAGRFTDGQVLVYQDMLGLTTGHTAKFVKRFAEVGALMRKGIADYISETREGTFPAEEHSYAIEDDVIEQLMRAEK